MRRSPKYEFFAIRRCRISTKAFPEKASGPFFIRPLIILTAEHEETTKCTHAKGLGWDNPEKKRGHSAKGLIEVNKELTL